MHPPVLPSELNPYLTINHPARQIVRNGVHLIGHVGHPIVGVDIADAEKIKAVYAQPNILEDALRMVVLIIEQAVTHADVRALIRRRAEGVELHLSVRR